MIRPFVSDLWSCRHEQRIGLQVLQQVYINHQNLDDELVDSIVWPAQDSTAAEVFYRIITGEGTPVNVLLDKLDKVQCQSAVVSPMS